MVQDRQREDTKADGWKGDRDIKDFCLTENILPQVLRWAFSFADLSNEINILIK
jgi:hypothetical protein